MSLDVYTPSCGHHGVVCSNDIIVRTPNCLFCAAAVLQLQLQHTQSRTRTEDILDRGRHGRQRRAPSGASHQLLSALPLADCGCIDGVRRTLGEFSHQPAGPAIRDGHHGPAGIGRRGNGICCSSRAHALRAILKLLKVEKPGTADLAVLSRHPLAGLIQDILGSLCH